MTGTHAETNGMKVMLTNTAALISVPVSLNLARRRIVVRRPPMPFV
jgi:hypothetical protein